jgi:cell wall-associated NlpC family hydrolase
MTVAGVTAVQSRVTEIQSLVAALEGRVPVGEAERAGEGSSFATALADAKFSLGSIRAPSAAGTSPDAAQVIDIAQQYLGVPYVYGGTDPNVGLDCSGFVQLVFRQVGIELPRVTYDQVNAGRPVASLADARPGDLIFAVGDRGQRVNGHVGIYLGDGKWIVAPKTGDVVKIADVPTNVTAIRRVLPDGASS